MSAQSGQTFGRKPDKGYVLFGYGPPVCPIGTFGEVARTSWVRRAFKMLSDAALVRFSDDMDGMRRVPSSVPNQGMLQAIGKPLTAVPDRSSRKFWPSQQRPAASVPGRLRFRL